MRESTGESMAPHGSGLSVSPTDGGDVRRLAVERSENGQAVAMDESTSSTESMKRALPDQRIGSYRVLQPLGSGGMSTVFRAVHVETGHEVALKVLTRTLAQEFDAAPAIPARGAERRDPRASQYRGDLRSRDRPGPALPGAGVRHGRRFPRLRPAARAARPGRGHRGHPSVAGGLKYAASRGLIHRDIKPSNILRTPTGEPKIIDLGLALQSEFEDERVTREGTTVGTVDYMAPEQARDSRATSIQSDMYSLGCTFYYLLRASRPFRAATSPTS